MELSRRLQAVADLLSADLKVADIGCDHGFLSIYLIEQKKAKWCLAMDVNQGPLERAKEHIRDRRLSTYIETRLCDGAREIRFLSSDKGDDRLEVDAAVLAGMGGKLMIRIIRDSLDKFRAMKEFILQPQSEIARVRRFIRDIGHTIVAEDMVFEEGRFYPLMKIQKGIDKQKVDLAQRELFDRYGQLLLRNRHPVLWQFLEKEKVLYEDILKNLKLQDSEKSILRQREIEETIDKIQWGLDWFKDEV